MLHPIVLLFALAVSLMAFGQDDPGDWNAVSQKIIDHINNLNTTWKVGLFPIAFCKLHSSMHAATERFIVPVSSARNQRVNVRCPNKGSTKRMAPAEYISTTVGIG